MFHYCSVTVWFCFYCSVPIYGVLFHRILLFRMRFIFVVRSYQLAQVDRIDFGFGVCYYWDIVEMVKVVRAMCFRCSIPMMSLAFDEVEKCFLLAICWYVWIAISGFKFFPRLVAMMLLDDVFLPVATTPLDRGLVMMLADMIVVTIHWYGAFMA